MANMGNGKHHKFELKNILIALLIIVVLYFIIDYLWQIFVTDGSEKLVLRAILIAGTILGLAHVILFFLRKAYQKNRDQSLRPRKRFLEKTRNIVNYITPFILLLMLYHFWEREWILTTIIVSILLIDRVNDLLRNNK